MGNIVLKITALIFGIALWFLVISQKDFQLTVEVPLNFVKLPETMAIASRPPHTLKVTIAGKSWDLIRLKQITSNVSQNSIAMVVDMQKAILGEQRIHLDKNNFQAAGFSDIHFIEPENQLLFIDVDIDSRITRNIPIKTITEFKAAGGYLIANEPVVKPYEIIVSGARNALARIIDIPTDTLYFDSLTQSKTYDIPLNFSMLPSFVYPSDSSIKISVDVQKMSSKVFDKVPVTLIGAPDKLQKYYSEPKTLSVEITGGIVALDSITSQNIDLAIEINRFEIEDADSLAPTIKLMLPQNINREMAIKAMQLKPEKITLRKKEVLAVQKNDSLKEALE